VELFPAGKSFTLVLTPCWGEPTSFSMGEILRDVVVSDMSSEEKKRTSPHFLTCQDLIHPFYGEAFCDLSLLHLHSASFVLVNSDKYESLHFK
jgi:hypothetical protein